MGALCINCGWENPNNMMTCEKCHQPLTYQNVSSKAEIIDEVDSPITITIPLQNVNESVVLNNRYELIAHTQKMDNSDLWLANDLYTNDKISVIIPEREDVYLNRNILQEYKFLCNLKMNGVLSPLHYDISEERAFYIVPQISSSLASYVGEIGFDMVERFIVLLAGAIATVASKKKGIGRICPNNILVSPAYSLYLTTSAFASFSTSSTTITGDATKNTNYLPYLAPEFFSSEYQIYPSTKGDIWALGASIYELITGERPFGNKGGGALRNGEKFNSHFHFHSTVENDYKRLHRLQYLVYRCLEQNPNDRPTPSFIRSSLLIKTVKSEKKERLYGLILPPFGVIYSIECDSLSEFSAQSVPGPGPFPHISSFFMGAFFEDGDECGYLKLEDSGQIREYSRMSKENYKHLCQLT